MDAVQVRGLGGDTGTIGHASIEQLRADLDGSLLRPDDDRFAEAIVIWNGMISKRPAIVVQARSRQDVVRTVEFVREQGLELSIKGGGHNIAGLALSDGGVTLDMSKMRDVAVDPEAGLVRGRGGLHAR